MITNTSHYNTVNVTTHPLCNCNNCRNLRHNTFYNNDNNNINMFINNISDINNNNYNASIDTVDTVEIIQDTNLSDEIVDIIQNTDLNDDIEAEPLNDPENTLNHQENLQRVQEILFEHSESIPNGIYLQLMNACVGR